MVLEHGTLWRGQHFGEHSLLLRCLRMHGVATASPVELLALNKVAGGPARRAPPLPPPSSSSQPPPAPISQQLTGSAPSVYGLPHQGIPPPGKLTTG